MLQKRIQDLVRLFDIKVAQRARRLRLRALGCRIGRGTLVGKEIEIVGGRVQVGECCLIESRAYFKTLGLARQEKGANIVVGDGAFIGYGSVLDANLKITIGRCALIAPYCFITDSSHRYEESGSSIMAQGGVYEEVIIGEDVWVGTHCIILKGVTIGRGAVIAANSLVNTDVEPFSVVAGTPAKPIGKRRAQS